MWIKIWLGAFKWATSHYHSLRGCKNVTYQSWNSEKIALCISLLLCKKGFENTRVRSFFRPPTLTGHITISTSTSVCPSMRPSVRPSVRPCVQKLAPILAVVSHNVTNKSCLVCAISEKYSFWVTLIPQSDRCYWGKAEVRILDFKTTWSEFQKASQTATEPESVTSSCVRKHT